MPGHAGASAGYSNWAPGYPWWALGIITLPIGGPLVRVGSKVARPVVTWTANQLLFKPLWRVQQGFANPVSVASSLHTAATWSDRVRLGMAVVGLVEGSSSESYQQNGGPSAPLHQRGQPAPLVVPAASSSAHGGGRSGAKPRKRKSCPKGYIWSPTEGRCIYNRDAWFRKG